MVLGVLIWKIHTLEWEREDTCTLKLRFIVNLRNHHIFNSSRELIQLLDLGY